MGDGEEAEELTFKQKMLRYVDDVIGFGLRVLPAPYQMFVDGVGGDSAQELLDRLKTESIDSFPPLEMVVENKRTGDSTKKVRVSRYSFHSPLREHLPERETRRGFVEMLEPRKGAINGVVIILAAFGDMSFKFRRDYIAMPLAEQGYACVLPVGPYMHALRQPKDQTLFYVRSINQVMTCAIASIVEAAKLIDWVQNDYKPGVPLAITGASIGGNFASCAALITKGDIAVVPVNAPYSGATFLEGQFSGALRMPKLKAEDRLEVKHLLRNLDVLIALGWSSVPVKKKKKRSRERMLVVHQLAANSDPVVGADSSVKLSKILKEDAAKFTYKTYSGGHYSVLFEPEIEYIPTVIAAIAQLAAVQSGEEKVAPRRTLLHKQNSQIQSVITEV